MYKQVIVVRKDLKLPKGKLCAQVAHGSVQAMRKRDERTVKKWLEKGGKKVVVTVQGKEELLAVFSDAKNSGLKPALIKDAGHTVVSPGTMTVVGIGPEKENVLDNITGSLSLL